MPNYIDANCFMFCESPDIDTLELAWQELQDKKKPRVTGYRVNTVNMMFVNAPITKISDEISVKIASSVNDKIIWRQYGMHRTKGWSPPSKKCDTLATIEISFDVNDATFSAWAAEASKNHLMWLTACVLDNDSVSRYIKERISREMMFPCSTQENIMNIFAISRFLRTDMFSGMKWTSVSPVMQDRVRKVSKSSLFYSMLTGEHGMLDMPVEYIDWFFEGVNAASLTKAYERQSRYASSKGVLALCPPPERVRRHLKDAKLYDRYVELYSMTKTMEEGRNGTK